MRQAKGIRSRIRIAPWRNVSDRTDCRSVLLWLRRCTCLLALFSIQVAVSPVGAEAADEKLASNEAKLDRTQHDAEVDPSLYTRPDVVYKVEEEPLTRQLTASEPEAIKRMLEFQYVAVVELANPKSPSFDHSMLRLIPKEFWKLTYKWSGALYVIVERPDEYTAVREYSDFFCTEYFAQLAAMISRDKLPADALLSCFTKGPGKVPFLTIRRVKYSDGAVDRSLKRFEILAPTEDKARGLASTLLVLFDQGLTRQFQIHLHKSKRAAEGHLEKRRKELKEAEEESGQLQKQLETPVVVALDSLVELRTQCHLLSVDLAGAKARVLAAERFLEMKTALRQGREHVENLKITAEIELAGLAARQQALDLLIKAGEERVDLQNRAKLSRRRVAEAEHWVAQYEEALSNADEAIELLRPFRLHGGKVVIRPVKWSAAPEDETSR